MVYKSPSLPCTFLTKKEQNNLYFPSAVQVVEPVHSSNPIGIWMTGQSYLTHTDAFDVLEVCALRELASI